MLQGICHNMNILTIMFSNVYCWTHLTNQWFHMSKCFNRTREQHFQVFFVTVLHKIAMASYRLSQIIYILVWKSHSKRLVCFVSQGKTKRTFVLLCFETQQNTFCVVLNRSEPNMLRWFVSYIMVEVVREICAYLICGITLENVFMT